MLLVLPSYSDFRWGYKRSLHRIHHHSEEWRARSAARDRSRLELSKNWNRLMMRLKVI